MRKHFYLLALLLAIPMKAISEETWLHQGSDVPAFKLILKENGVAEFVEGFTWLNPMKWERKDDDLIIHIDKMDEPFYQSMQHPLKSSDGCLSQVDRNKIVYYEELCDYLNIGGYIFYKQEN
ncbi:hypothetical protein [Cellvibrio sp. OA-2007]|uniref:hypothetical protein n=1 Tax=Cellvibrio sp. OA-2007 TaxID=529823 RepID=UPI00126A1E9A|nr:hypothetical protein [Cellvibrio sp. OA-2007]